MSNSQSIRQTYYPLLPKMKTAFPGGHAAGEWTVEGVPLFKKVADNLDFDVAKYTEINSIPSPWSKSLQFISAMLNSNYPSRDWLIAQYRGLLAAIALSENLGLSLQTESVNLETYQNIEFGRCLTKLKPSDDYNILGTQSSNSTWYQLFLFELNEEIIGFTSPATLVVPVGYLSQEVERRIPWVKNGFFVDPTSNNNGLTNTYRALLAPWLNNLRNNLLAKNINTNSSPVINLASDLSNSLAKELQLFQQALNVQELNEFKPSVEPNTFAEKLTPVLLKSLKPAQPTEEKSNVEIIPSSGLGQGKKKLHLIDPKLSAVMDKVLEEINVIGSSSLANFDRNLYRRADAIFLTDTDLFAKDLFYFKNKGLLPGTWLDRKLNLENLTIFLPLNPILKDYFSSQDLEKNIQLTACSTPDGPGVRVTLNLKLSGFEKPVNYSIYKDFPLNAGNEITLPFPTLALWPNVPPGKWSEYFVFIEVSEEFGDLAFSIEQPTDKATQETRQSGQEKYRYWKCDCYPEILSAIDKDGQFLGLLPLNSPKHQPSTTGTWTVGVDFGTSFTNIYVRKGSGQPERFVLQTNLLKITKGLQEIDAITYREFFIPDAFFPEGGSPPISSVLTTRGWQETDDQISHVIDQSRIYVPTSESHSIKDDYIKTNIKWKNVEYQRPFLGQLTRWIATQAAVESVRSIDWVVSYPSAFSRKEQNGYANSWRLLLENLTKITGQSHKLADHEPIRTESIVFAQFFADVLKKDLIHTTCADIGGGTSDISIWQENDLIHQASVPYAGRDIFHRILQPNLAFIGDIFGLSPTDANEFRKNFSGKNNFNLALDIYLRFYAEEILRDKYVINIEKQRNREFRTLVAFALGGLYHYFGLVQKYLVNNPDSKLKRTDVTSILVGGNGSRFLHWLTITGTYNHHSEINILLDGILTKASGLESSPEVMTLSTYPKDEACGGLVVPPDGKKLKGLEQDQEDYPFLGEACKINDQDFTAEQRLELADSWENIEDFRVTSFSELERYIANFNEIIKDKKIQEIDPLRNFDRGGLFSLTDNVRTLLERSVTDSCLCKRVPIAEFEPEPPFLITLKCLVGVLADQWSKTAN